MFFSFKAKKVLFFTVDGMPVLSDYKVKATEEKTGRYSGNYWDNFRYITRMAMREQKWEKTSEPIYLCVNVFIGAVKHNGDEKTERQRRQAGNHRFTKRLPNISNFIRQVVIALQDIAFDNGKQIVAIQSMKEVDNSSQRVEIFMGIPEDWGGIVSDLQKIE